MTQSAIDVCDREDSRNCIKFHAHCWYWWDRGSFSMIICYVPVPQYNMLMITYVEKVGNWSVIFTMLSYSNFLRWMIIILIFLPIQPQSVFSTCIITGGCWLKGRSQIFKNISNVYRHFYNKLYGSFRQSLNWTETGNIGLLYIFINSSHYKVQGPEQIAYQTISVASLVPVAEKIQHTVMFVISTCVSLFQREYISWHTGQWSTS